MDNIISQNIDRCIDQIITVPKMQNQNILVNGELHNYILSNILSSKYRKTKVDKDTIESIDQKVLKAINTKSPIEFAIPFGAYKGWKLPTHPETDWGEVFNISHIINYLLPISNAYQYGITVYYTFQDNIMHEISNIPKRNFELYKECFLRLLNYFNSQLNGIRLELFSISNLYPSEKQYYEDYQKGFEYNLLHWNEKYSESERIRKVNSAKNNLAKKGVIDYSDLNDDEWEQKCIISAMQTDAVDCLYWRRKFNKNSNRIQLVFVRGPENSIHIGSCITSTAHFWAGTGVLEFNKKILPRILTQNNYLSALHEDRLYSYKLECTLSTISKNYSNIQIMK